jgi:hypothetical protein
MVLNQFNGRVALKLHSKIGANFSVTMIFKDERTSYRGIDARIGDYVYLKASDGKFYRLKVTDIESQNALVIVATLTDETAQIRNFSAQNAAIFRETANRQYPLFISGISPVMQAAIGTHLSILIDQNTAQTGCKSTITAAELDGTEFIPILKNGESRCLPISEAIEYFLTLTSPNGNRRRLELTDYDQTEWAKRPPQ